MLGLLLTACQGAPPPDVHASADSPEVLMRVADDTRNGGDPGTAIEIYRRVHEMKPDDPKPLARLGSTLLQLKAYTEAASAYRAALDLDSKDPNLHRGLATVLLALNQPSAALPELEKAAAQDPNDARLFNAMGVAHDLLGRHDLAQQNYREATRLAPESQGIKNNYGLSLALSGDYGAAATTLGEIADGIDSSPRYRLNLALVYGLAGDDRKAAAIARTALDETAVRSNLAYYALLRGMDDKARATAIMGGQIQGPSALKDPPSEPIPGPPPATKSADVTAAPVTPVAQAALPSSPSEPAKTDATAMASTPPASGSAPAAAATAAAPSDAAPPAANPVKLATAEPASQPAPVAAMAPIPDPAPAAKSAKHTKHAETKKAETKKAEAEKPAQPAGGDFVVQVGSFASEANAHKLADQLSGKGYKMSVAHHRDHNGRDWYAVRAGGFATAEQAATAAEQMRQSEQIPAVVVHLHGPSEA